MPIRRAEVLSPPRPGKHRYADRRLASHRVTGTRNRSLARVALRRRAPPEALFILPGSHRAFAGSADGPSRAPKASASAGPWDAARLNGAPWYSKVLAHRYWDRHPTLARHGADRELSSVRGQALEALRAASRADVSPNVPPPKPADQLIHACMSSVLREIRSNF